MISENYNHRWEPLAEVHFSVKDKQLPDDDNYTYCLCSRVYLRDSIKLYLAEKEDYSESDAENPHQESDEQSHVHFSIDTSYKVKCDRDEGASCYCSASHTDNYCSTDEHDPQTQSANALQPSDSGADLTYHDGLDFNPKTLFKTNEVIKEQIENYLTEDSWEKFWSFNGERLIWQSWINKYSNYINPDFFESSSVLKDETNEETDEYIRERRFSYDSKVNPYNKKTKETKIKSLETENDDLARAERRRSFSEHERILSPRTLTTTDSMTNVTKITLSSYDVTSSHVTSESSPDDCSISSSTSEEQSNDQTKIANDDMFEDITVEEMDSETYWQYLWKQHFGEQYSLHYANYVESQHAEAVRVQAAKISPPIDEYETSDGNSQELPSVIEVQNRVKELKIDKTKKKGRDSLMYVSSVGLLLQSLIKEESQNMELVDAGDQVDKVSPDLTEGESKSGSENQTSSNIGTSVPSHTGDGDGDGPPEERPIKFKSSHETDDQDQASDEIKKTFTTMGLCLSTGAPLGQLVYRKQLSHLRPPKQRKLGPKKTYFDDEGMPYSADKSLDSQDDEKIDDDLKKVVSLELSSNDDVDCAKDTETEVSNSLSKDSADSENKIPNETTKRKRRKRKRSYKQDSEIPIELRSTPHMSKYWRKRHSLFHKFEEGIRLDSESWFSATPESVARHTAARCRCDVLLDAFTGAGGNAIQFAFQCERVIAIDVDPVKIELARHNAQVYGVADRIEFIIGDFFQLAPHLKADVVFLSPPWGGPKYIESAQYDLETMLEPKPLSVLMEAAQKINHNIALYVPRNSKSEQLLESAKESGAVEIEQNFLGRRFIALTAYYGDLIKY